MASVLQAILLLTLVCKKSEIGTLHMSSAAAETIPLFVRTYASIWPDEVVHKNMVPLYHK
jgi:hypothetical protein